MTKNHQRATIPGKDWRVGDCTYNVTVLHLQLLRCHVGEDEATIKPETDQRNWVLMSDTTQQDVFMNLCGLTVLQSLGEGEGEWGGGEGAYIAHLTKIIK
jgi:hypothetical protein